MFSKKGIEKKLNDMLSDALVAQSKVISFSVNGRSYSIAQGDEEIKCAYGLETVPFDAGTFSVDYAKLREVFGAFL